MKAPKDYFKWKYGKDYIELIVSLGHIDKLYQHFKEYADYVRKQDNKHTIF